jgi:putative DNA primase/helicase
MSKKPLPPEITASLKGVADAELAATSAAQGSTTLPHFFIQRRQLKWPELTAGGAPKKTMMNAMMAIQKLELECKLDVFHGRYIVNGTNLATFHGELSDMIARKIRELSFAHFGLDPGVEATSDGMRRMCEEHRYDPIQDYLNALVWDRKPRLDTWLTTYLGVKDTPLRRAQGSIVLTAAVTRIFDHGCKFDHVLVLEGPEGVRKSSVVQVLASGKHGRSDNFSDSPILNTDERKQQELTQGVWFYEIAELAGMRKADQFAVKNFITKQEERARPAYAEFSEVRPRVCIFIGTFNTTTRGELIEYLNAGDQRRWWPVLAGKINIPALMRDRDQLFAEAMVEYALGAELYLDPQLEAEAKGEAALREKSDPLADTLSDLLNVVLKMHRTKVTSDDSRVSIKPGNSGAMLVKGREAVPFAIIGMDEVWVSSKYVIECVPASRKNDGNGIAAAMRKLGWASVEDRRSGAKKRGYLITLEDPTA